MLITQLLPLNHHHYIHQLFCKKLKSIQLKNQDMKILLKLGVLK